MHRKEWREKSEEAKWISMPFYSSLGNTTLLSFPFNQGKKRQFSKIK